MSETAASAMPAGPLALAGPSGNLSRLSHRELEVLRLRAEGISVKGVAAALGVTENTVKWTCQRAFARIVLPDGSSATTVIEAFIGLGWLRVPAAVTGAGVPVKP